MELSSAGGRSALVEVLVVGAAVLSEEVVREFKDESPRVVYESERHVILDVQSCVHEHVDVDYHA